jgi:hypothetical protein
MTSTVEVEIVGIYPAPIMWVHPNPAYGGHFPVLGSEESHGVLPFACR